MASECSVCLQGFKSPKILPCFHTFCEKCLCSLVEEAAGQIQERAWPATGLSFLCPMCRAITKVPAGGVSAFQTNFYIKADIQLKQNEAFPACDVCTKREKATSGDRSELKCMECDKFLCTDCAAVHNELLASHTLASITQAGKVKVTRKAFCQKHLAEELRFFCTRCQTPVCRDCRMTSHAEGHTSVDLEDMSKKAKEFMAKTRCLISRDIIPNYKDLVTRLAENVQENRELAERIKDLIGTKVSELQKILEDGKASALKTVDDTVSGLEIGNRIYYDQLTRLESQSDHINQVLEMGCGADIMVAAENLKTSVAEITELAQQDICHQTVGYDRSDSVHIEMSKPSKLNLDQWASFAARYVGKVLNENTEDLLANHYKKLIEQDGMVFRALVNDYEAYKKCRNQTS